MTTSTSNVPTGDPIVYQRRGFWSLFAASFQEAFNDLSFRTLVTFFVLGLGLSQADRNSLVSLTLALFALPFILFSMMGGYLADRYSKRDVSIALKAVELFSMSLGVLALALGSVPLLLTVVFLISAQSALFGPSKWGLLPELLPEKKMSWGNGLLQFATYISGIVGTVAGGALSEAYQGRTHWGAAILVGTAFLGFLVMFGIRRTPVENPSRQFRLNQVSELMVQLRTIRSDRTLALAVLGNGYFLFLATLLQANILRYGKDVLELGDTQNGYLQAAVAVGIGVGALAAGYLSGNKIELGLVPLGAVGLVVMSATLSQSDLTFFQVAAALVGLGFAGGFFIVPIGALIQYRPEASQRGGVIAAANWLSWAGAFLAAGVDYLLSSVAGFAPSTVFLFGGVLTLAGAVYALILLPAALLRFLLWLLTVTIYRIRVLGRDNIPENGGALLVSNHLSMIDAILVQASSDRTIRFLMDREWYDKPWLKPFVKLLEVIPVSSHSSARDLLHSLREAHDVVAGGGVACIFAEGQITRTGNLLPFRRGFERIMRGPEGTLDAPIIPVHLDNLWGSIFSYERGRFVWKPPRRIPYPVIVSYGQPMAATATPAEVRVRVQELHPDAFQHHREWLQPLHRCFLSTARRHPFRFAMADARVPKLSWFATLLKTIFLGRRLKKVWVGQEKVGILLPPSVGGALVNYAALIAGKVPVNLNYTASNEIVADCARQCNLKTVITSRLFLEKVPMQVPGKTIFLEDLAQNPRITEKLFALLLAFTPARIIERALGSRRPAALDDIATVIFSSGSTGVPKGVVLTQFNLAANLEQASQIIHFLPADRILGVLPFFHSFGFLACLWLPPAVRIGVVFHPNPTEAKAIGELVRKYAVTILMSTPTFLQNYIRRCEPEEFGSLRVVITGAEKLPQRVVEAFEERFGLRPLEGYGCTECAPLVAANTGDIRAPGMRQVGARRGKIGQPVPGMAVRIVDPETGAPVSMGQPGLLLVRGPNVMTGYLGMPEKTAEVLRDGWYSTGDMAFVDEEGFIEITDRLSRFSKIGGEMVPHIKIEETLQALAGITEQVFAVASLPDEKKGERLVVLHTLNDEQITQCVARLADAPALPNLWKPDKRAYYRVEAIPYLGSGKLDLRRIRELARQMTNTN
ncbi:MAG: MFS transporter [Acidobacteria bacterium]|nr:MFS transporter [Acidobacteriota bacterium]